jgi:thiamine biosynthesis lipoprotein
VSEEGHVTLATRAMGCRFELVLAGGPAPELRSAGADAIELIHEAHERLTRFERGSVVTRLNEGRTERVDAELFSLFETCEEFRNASGGVFDVSIGGSLILDASSSTVRVERGSVDMGAIGKGYAVDIAIRALEEAGVASAFVHAGTSTARALGVRANGSPWRVSLGAETGLEPITVDLTDRAMSVSGDAVQGAHLVDPRTGERRSGVYGACVGPSAMRCDAWSTALALSNERPDGMAPDEHSIVMDENSWRIEPDGASAVEERAACPRSTVVLS